MPRHRIRTITVSKEVEIDLCDFSSADLMKELEDRGEDFQLTPLQIASALRTSHAPEEIIKAVEEWAHEPAPTSRDLAEWIAWALS